MVHADSVCYMTESRKNVWKYLSIGLLSFLGMGVVVGSAYGAPDPYSALVSAINDLTTAIENKETTVVVNSIEGPEGPQGLPGANGVNGLHCWDLDGDGLNGLEEDINGDGYWNAIDCQGSASGFKPNTAPVVDAGADQQVLGQVASGGCVLINICYSGYILSCEYDLVGDVKDDAFTGFLSHKWGPSSQNAVFSAEDDLATHLTIIGLSPTPYISDVTFPVTLTANDGILETSDEVLLTCQIPA